MNRHVRKACAAVTPFDCHARKLAALAAFLEQGAHSNHSSARSQAEEMTAIRLKARFTTVQKVSGAPGNGYRFWT